MKRVAAFALALGVTACPEASNTLSLEASPRSLSVGAVELTIKLPEGIEHHQTTKNTIRHMMPGRGGAVVHLSLTTASQDLASAVRRTENGPKINGLPPIVVHHGTIKDRDFMTIKDAKGWFISATSWTPLPAGAAPPFKTLVCHANIGRSRPIVDPEQKRKTLEAICQSVAFPH